MNKAKVICPLMGTECIEDGAIIDGELKACRFWVKLLGKNPQTGEDIDQGNCAISWIPILTIENSKMQRETGAAVESFRNEVVQGNNSTLDLIGALTNVKRLPG